MLRINRDNVFKAHYGFFGCCWLPKPILMDSVKSGSGGLHQLLLCSVLWAGGCISRKHMFNLMDFADQLWQGQVKCGMSRMRYSIKYSWGYLHCISN